MSLENAGRKVGFFAGLMIFSSLGYFLLSKLGVLNVQYIYFIAVVIALHVAYSAAKEVRK